MDEGIPMEVFESQEELKELEELQFSKQVIGDIARKRKRHENKLAWPSVENYIDYIGTERRLLALINCKDKFPEKKKVVEARLIKKINRLYKDARSKLGDDYQLLMDYFQFLKEVKAKIRAKEIIELIMQRYPEKEEAWLLAISWYIQTHNPESTIRQTINKALVHHSASVKIFGEAFTFEAKSIKNYYALHGQLSEEVLERIKEYIDLFFKNTEKQINQYFEVLSKFDEFECEKEIKDYFQRKIMEICKDEPAFWEHLVKRENKETTSLSSDGIFEGKTGRCIAIYEKGIGEVSESKRIDLWSLYLKFLLDVCSWEEVAEGSPRKEDLKFVNGKFEEAHKNKYLTEDLYFFWIELDKKMWTHNVLREVNVAEKPYEANYEMFEKGLQVYPQSVRLWKAYLSACINHDKTSDKITELFERAVVSVKENASQLWLIYLNNCQQVEEREYVDAMYLKAMQDSKVVLTIARNYLNWLYLVNGIEKCRNVYDSLVEKNLASRDVHRAMLKFEFLEYEGDCERWEKVYKNTLEQFPHDIDIWMDYMQFHMKYKRSSEETISALYTRAINSLPDSLQLLWRQRVAADEL